MSANENLGRAALESKVRVGIGDVVQRPGVFVAQAHFDGRRAGKLEAVLEEAIGRPRAKLHLRNAGLALLHGGQTEQETGEGGSAAVVCAGSRRVAARELVVAAILEEAPHRPDIVAKTAAEVQTVTAALPTEGIAALDGGVPSAHRRGGVGIAHAGITLHVKPRRPPGTRPAKAYAQNTQLRNDVVGVGALRKVAHGQARKGHRGDVYQVRRDNAVPGHAALLGKIVVAGAKARDVNGHESALGTERIPRRKRARGRENLVDAGRALVVDVMFVAHVEIIVAIDAGPNHPRCTHHRAAARHHAHRQVRLRDVFLEKELRRDAQVRGGNQVIRKRNARIGWAGRLPGSGHMVGIVDGDAAHLEIAGDFLGRGNRLGHRIGLGMPVTFVVEKEKGFVVNEGTAERSAKIVLHEKFRRAHRSERVRVHRSVAQEIVGRAVKRVASGASDDIDLPAAGSSHFRGIAAGFHLEFLHRVRRGAETHGIECRVRVGGAVKQEIVRVRPVAADADGGPLAGSPVKRVHVTGLRAVAHVRAGNREHQIDEHAAIQGQIADRGGLNDFSNAGINGVEQVGRGRVDLDNRRRRS